MRKKIRLPPVVAKLAGAFPSVLFLKDLVFKKVSDVETLSRKKACGNTTREPTFLLYFIILRHERASLLIIAVAKVV